MKTRSLSRTLTVGVLAAELLCAALLSFVAIAHEVSDRRRAFDIMLSGRADSLLGAVQDAEDPNDNVVVDETELSLPPQDAYEVIMDSGRVVGRSPGSSTALLNELSSHTADGYFNFKVEGKYYRGLRKPGIRVIDRDENGGIRRPVTLLYAASTAHLWHQAVEAVRFYVIAGALLLLLTGVVMAWFLRRSLSPLRELADRAARVSTSAWEFAPPQQALSTRELQPIASSIQALLLGLRQSFERQRQFTGDAAHELKTSIAVLKSSLQLLTLRQRTSDEYTVAIEGLLLDTERMEDLTNRMLALARLEQAPPDVRAAADLCSTLGAVAERLQPALQLRGVPLLLPSLTQLAVRIAPDEADVLCSNLLMNALQHSGPGRAITVTLQRDTTTAILTFADEGEGIAPDALPHVFERFYRADDSRSRNNGGVGLGLAICKGIADRSGGVITIRSALGQGTRVEVVLPLAAENDSALNEAAPN